MPAKIPAETRKKIYHSLCHVLSDRRNQVAWAEFTPTDWDLFAHMAEAEGVASLMYWKLKDSQVEVPSSTFNLLRSTYYQTLAQNTLMYQELERILKALDEVGIEVIVLKGAALATTVYEDIGLRPMGDLDLLVREEQFQAALAVMRGIGYAEEPLPFLEFNREIGYTVHLWRGLHNKLKVELHWRLITAGDVWYRPSMDCFWEQTENLHLCIESQSIKLNNALALSSGASLLYLVGHLMLQHGIEQSRLLWFYDINLLVCQSSRRLDWEALYEQADGNRWTPALRAALARVQRLFNTTFPSEIIAALSQEERLSPNSVYLFWRRALQTRTKATDVLELSSFLSYRERIRYTIAMVVPSPAYMRWRYSPKPDWLWPLSYPYRWLRLVREAVITLSKLIFSIPG